MWFKIKSNTKCFSQFDIVLLVAHVQISVLAEYKASYKRVILASKKSIVFDLSPRIFINSISIFKSKKAALLLLIDWWELLCAEEGVNRSIELISKS